MKLTRRGLLKGAGLAALGYPARRLHADTPFTFAMIGDPHLCYGGSGQPLNWETQAAWIVANQAAQNIQGVFCVGDIEELYGQGNPQSAGTNSDTTTAFWTEGWSAIAGMGVPFGSCIGNHDYDPDTYIVPRVSANFDANIGYSKMSGQPSYGGYWTGDPGGYKSNQYLKFTVGNRRFVVIFLEFFPRAAAVAWAQSIILANPYAEIVIVTHAAINGDGDGLYPVTNWFGASYAYGPEFYSLADYPANYSGQNIHDWAVQFPNVRLILCGHSDEYQRVTCTGNAGNTFYGIMTDFQERNPSSSFAILLLQFAYNTLTVNVVNTNTGGSVLEHSSGTDYSDSGAATYPADVMPYSPVGLFPLPGGFQRR